MKTLILYMTFLAAICAARADLLLYYDFEDDISGATVTDKSGYGHDGIRTNVIWGDPNTDTPPQYVTSHDGSTAIQFGYTDEGTAGGAYNYIQVGTGYNDTLARIGSSFSMSFWARQDLSGSSLLGSEYGPAYGRVISTPNYEIELGAGDNGDPASYFWPYNAVPASGVPQSWDMSMASNPEDVWFHMAVTYDGITLIQYIDGAPVFQNDQMVPFDENTWAYEFPSDTAMMIGAQCYPREKSFMVGLLDDVAIWGNCYLDSDAVAGLFSGIYTPLTVPTIPTEPLEPTPPGYMSTLGLTGLWRFESALEDESATRMATIGMDLTAGNPSLGDGFRWYTGPWTALGTLSNPGSYSDYGVSQISEWGYYTVYHNIMPNGDGTKVNEYTILMDYVQTGDLGQWNALVQVDSDAHGSDAEFWTSPTGQIGVGAEGIGYSTLTYDPSTWHRIVFSIDNGNFWRAYVDGILFLDAPGQAIDGRWALNDYFHLFADNTWEEVGWGLCGQVVVWGRALSTAEIANMGGWLDDSGNPTPLTISDIACSQWDFVCDGCIDLEDLVIFVSYWLESGCDNPYWCGGADLTIEGEVNLEDFRVFSSHWLEGCPLD